MYESAANKKPSEKIRFWHVKVLYCEAFCPRKRCKTWTFTLFNAHLECFDLGETPPQSVKKFVVTGV